MASESLEPKLPIPLGLANRSPELVQLGLEMIALAGQRLRGLKHQNGCCAHFVGAAMGLGKVGYNLRSDRRAFPETLAAL
jgi:hypothetical protein